MPPVLQARLPIFFGNLTQDFVAFTLTPAEAWAGSADAAAQPPIAAAHFRNAAAKNATYMTIWGIGMFLTAYIYMHIWAVTSELSSSKRIRERYLQAVMRPGSDILRHRRRRRNYLVQQRISEKVASAVSFIAGFISGFVLAFVRSWRMAPVLSTMLPFTSSLEHVAEGETLAEETISTIRTAHAFGTQETLAALYDGFVKKARSVDIKAATLQGGGFGSFYHIRLARRTPVTGTFSLVIFGPEVQAIVLAMGAAGKLFATIDLVPLIDSAAPSGNKPFPVPGSLSSENIHFTYLSRPDVPVLKAISLTSPRARRPRS
ncbi:hypothetical protein DFH09DRAFT_1370129 [Mycena vulgaris]|nr:hypothetical protein DFH09DRAFT_1370129 [Mycena vulgaris]